MVVAVLRVVVIVMLEVIVGDVDAAAVDCVVELVVDVAEPKHNSNSTKASTAISVIFILTDALCLAQNLNDVTQLITVQIQTYHVI